MSYFAGGAWWTSDGRAFSTQAEAEAAERSGAGATTEDEFSAAIGRGNGTGAQASTPAQPRVGNAAGPLSSGRASGFQGTPSAPQGTAAQQQQAFAGGNIGGAGGAGGADQVLTDRMRTPSDPGLFRQAANTVGSFLDNPLVNPIGYGASRVGRAIDRAAGTSVSGYIQDPVGQGLSDLGAPDAVQAAANPTGYIARTAVNANNGYGTLPGATLNNAGRAFDNLSNDARNTATAVQAAPGYVAGLASGAAGAIGRSTNAPTYQPPPPPPMPTPQMTSQQILGMNTNAARPSSAQSDAIVQQMLGQANVQSGYQDFSSPQYDASRSAAMGYTSQLAGLANNNVAITGLDSGRYDQSRGTMNQITGQLQSQANNNVEDIQASSGQRDSTRGNVLATAGMLTNHANSRDVARVDADQTQRLGAQGIIRATENQLLSGQNNVGDIYADDQLYRDSRATSDDVIARLIALTEAQEGPSAAESLMLNAQERATRNALGNASSMGGGWRSQVTNQRAALGQAAAQQADIAAQLGALRANEAATFRDQNINALGLAGGFSGDMSARDLALATSDADRLTQIAQGNQANTRESQIAAGALATGRMNSDTTLAMSDADRAIMNAQANNQNRLNALLGAGGLQASTLASDTSLAQSNASLLAQIRQGNQLNALQSLNAAANAQGTTLNADLGFATNDAQIRTQRELANQQNALNAMLGAASAANTTAGLDANIGTANADRRALVDQNNRANSIAALQNAGVLSSTIRGQDVQLSVADQQALSSRIASAAQLSGSTFATQMDAALRQQDLALRQQQFQFMQSQAPREWERYLAAAGSTAGLLGLIL